MAFRGSTSAGNIVISYGARSDVKFSALKGGVYRETVRADSHRPVAKDLGVGRYTGVRVGRSDHDVAEDIQYPACLDQ